MAISVVIVNFRADDELSRCLTALGGHQTDGPDIVVVDQPSGTSDARRVAEAFPRVRFVKPSANKGFAAGVNLGAQHVAGEWLLLVNPDCELRRREMDRLMAWADAHSTVGAIGPRIRNLDGTVQASARRFPGITTAFAGRSSWLTRTFPGNRFSRQNLPMPSDQGAPIDVDWVSGACVLVRRRAFDDIGGMDPRFFLYWEDADLGRRLKDRGWRTLYHPGVEAVHRVGASSQHAPVRSAVAFHGSALRYYSKHANPAARLAMPLIAVGLGLRLVVLLLVNYSRQLVRSVFGRPSPPVPRKTRDSASRPAHEVDPHV